MAPAPPAEPPAPGPAAPVAAPAHRRTAVRVAAIVAVTAAAVALLWGYANRHDFFDLRVYEAAMRWWAEGNDLYDYSQPDRVQGRLFFTYPPFAALLLRPLAAIPFGLTAAVFTLASLAAVAVTTRWLLAPVARGRGWPVWFAVALAAPLVVLTEPVRETLTFGQVNLLLVALILVDLLVLVPRGSRWAGAAIGVATAIKLFPGIVIAYLLVTRRWRAALVASLTAAAATLLAAAIAPRASWQFWTEALWATERVGRTDYTANQSLLGLLGRLVSPAPPSRLLWLGLVLLTLGYGLWRAGQAARAGDEVAGLTLTGLVGALISPITWPHHVYWFVPAVIVALDAGLGRDGADRHGRRSRWLALAAATYGVAVYGVVTHAPFAAYGEPTDDPLEFVVRNLYVLAMVALLVLLPIRRRAVARR